MGDEFKNSFTDVIKIHSTKEVAGNTFESKDTASKPKGLIVTFDLSHAGRRINDRIYPPWGQKAGVTSWVTPYRKPIIKNHNSTDDPIGRFLDVQWVSLEREALEHMGNVRDFLEVKRAFETKDAQKIYKTLDKFNLLNDKKWPGLSKLTARALITDQDAVEKFRDERYLTFSAGSHSNGYTCMSCGAEWHNNDRCDHVKGTLDENGKPVMFMTGVFYGDEGSVATKPADDQSRVTSMELQDSQVEVMSMVDTSGQSMFTFTDAEVELVDIDSSLGRNTGLDLGFLEPETVIALSQKDNLDFDLADALSGNTTYEVNWLIRIHDALHQEFDWQLRQAVEMGEANHTMPTAVYKLHGALHDLSLQKKFRDSLINGPLDEYDSAGASSMKYAVKRQRDSIDSLADMLEELKDGLMKVQESLDQQKSVEKVEDQATVVLDASAETATDAEDTSEVEDTNAETVTNTDEHEDSNESGVSGSEDKEEAQEEAQKDEEEVVATADSEEPSFVDDQNVDWFTLSLALESLVSEDAKLSSETRENLPTSAFCGPERSFPVNDCAHYTAALRLIDRYKGPGDKDKIRACIERKGKKLGCANQDTQSCNNCKCSGLTDLKKDYARALNTIETLEAKLEDVLEKHAQSLNVEISLDENTSKLDFLSGWFDSICTTDVEASEPTSKVLKMEDIQVVEDPGVDSHQDKALARELGDFEKQFINKYQEILDESGQDAANHYHRAQRRYLPNGFDPINYLR